LRPWPRPWPRPADRSPSDYIIVGGGTSGCLLGNRLRADAGKRVRMIEADVRSPGAVELQALVPAM